MSASVTRRTLAALACALLAACAQLASAQGNVNIGDLKLRSEAGDRTATRELAELYYVGREGVEQNFAEAARLYITLARQGDQRAQAIVGTMYARGYGVKKDPQSAVHWWRFAAVNGNAGAQYNLGLAYANGDGVARDYAQTVEWFSKAAQNGVPQAQHNLGMLYHEGRPGIGKDPQRAYFWVRIAMLNGDELAQESLKKVSEGMSADQIRQVEGQAAEWMKKSKFVTQ